jgi:hypothetical protein
MEYELWNIEELMIHASVIIRLYFSFCEMYIAALFIWNVNVRITWHQALTVESKEN